jgi:hypothetical protein
LKIARASGATPRIKPISRIGGQINPADPPRQRCRRGGRNSLGW